MGLWGCLLGANSNMIDSKNTALQQKIERDDVKLAMSPEQVTEATKKRAKMLEEDYNQRVLPNNFRFRDKWLEYSPPSDDDKEIDAVKICTRLEVVARTRDFEGMNHGRLIRFWDTDGIRHEWAMPMRMFAADGKEYRAELLDRGLIISTEKGARSLLNTYIQESLPELSLRCVSQTGWVENSFVLTGTTIGGNEDDVVVYQSEQLPLVQFAERGSLDDFHHLSNLSVGNQLMVFALSLAFAPPLLQPLDIENGGFNLVGPSSIGKTKLLKLAASVWGPPENVQQWRATSNGLEGVAYSFNDCLLCLDELGQIAPQDLGTTVYMLGNGVAKARAQRTGALRNPKRWRLIYFSSGELGIVEHISASNQKARVGQEVRAVDLYVGDRKYGCFDDLHNLKSGADFSLLIAEGVSGTYGVAGRTYLEKLVAHKEQAVASVKKLIHEMKNRYCPAGAAGQVCRVFERFAMVAASGELATSLGITGWEEGIATMAAMSLFEQWLETRGELGNREEQQIIDQIQLFFEKSAASRFVNVDDMEAKVIDGAGYRQRDGQGWKFYVYPNVYRKEVCKGFDPKYVTKVCLVRGLIVQGNKGEACPTWRAPGEGSKRFYHFTKAVLPELGGYDD